jgi:hypothetical protein
VPSTSKMKPENICLHPDFELSASSISTETGS